jgi:hypothetical protein
MLVVEGRESFFDVSGLAGHKVNQLWNVAAQALVTTHKGDAVSTVHQMALLDKDNMMLSCLQMEAYSAYNNVQSCLLPGCKQHIIVDGYQVEF